MRNLSRFIITFLLFLIVCPVFSQDIKGTITRARIINGDTIPVYDLEQVVIIAPREYRNKLEEMRHKRLVRHVKKVYPYAKLAGVKFREYAREIEKIEDESEQRRYMNQVEKELLEQFEGDLRKLTFTQGLILIKLIDRETRHTSYKILREFRGMFRAVFWQSLGRLFGYDLREEYDPWGEDEDIEHIILLIEAGVI